MTAFFLFFALPVLLLFAAEPKAAPEIPFDPQDYPEYSVVQVVEKLPCAKTEGPELRDALFRAEFVYQGAIRPASKPRYELMRRWTKSVGDPQAIVKYKSEVSFVDGKRTRWFSAPEGLVDFISMDFRPGDRVTLYLVYVGCTQGGPLFAVDEYEGVEQSEEEVGDTVI